MPEQIFLSEVGVGATNTRLMATAVSLIILATFIALPSKAQEAQANADDDTSVDPSMVTYTLKKFEGRIFGVVIPPKFATDAGVIAVARRLDQDLPDQNIDGIEIYDDAGAAFITDDGEFNTKSQSFNKKHTLGVYRRNRASNLNTLDLYDSKGTGKVIKGDVRQEISFIAGASGEKHQPKDEPTPDSTLDHWRTPGRESKWEYYEEPDEMGRGVKKSAHVDSLSTLSFQSPYQGPQLMRLVLQNSPKYGKVAYVKIERGQFMFTSYDDVAMTVRFEDGKPQKFQFLEPNDGSRNAAVIKSYEAFVRQLRRAKMIDIEAEFYLEGARVVTFDVHGLKQGW